MIRSTFFSALAAFGLAASSLASAAPVVIVNQGQNDSCTITPSNSTVFSLSDTGDVLINGSYTAGNCSTPGTGGGGGDPTFNPFSPSPADLSVVPSTFGSAGGATTPAFVVYNATSCTGKVTATTGCPALTGAWGTGGTVCTGQQNASGQTYCAPTGTVAIPANTTGNQCSYTFQAINCTNGSASINSQMASLTVSAQAQSGGCSEGSATGELASYGFTRQCSGTVRSFNNSLSPHWTTNTVSDILSAAWPGSASQYGFGLAVTVNATQYGSWKFNTGATEAGVHFESNSSYGVQGLMSVSTSPGDFFSGTTAVCKGSTLNISSKAGTSANCKLSLNTDYYINIAMVDPFGSHGSTCGTGTSCTTGWTVYGYGN